MIFPPELQAFSRLTFWNLLFFLLAVGVVGYSVWAFWRRREHQDLYYLALGIYLVAVQMPTVFPEVGRALGVGSLLNEDFTPRFLVALPVMVLFGLAVRSR